MKIHKSEYPKFYLKLVIIGLGTYIVSTLGIYLFAIITGFDVNDPHKIYKVLTYFLVIAGLVSANTCGRQTRTIFGKSISPSVIGAIATTWVTGLLIWFIYYFVGVYYFPEVTNDVGGIFLWATLCMVGWTPI